jgi:hypothetical protein
MFSYHTSLLPLHSNLVSESPIYIYIYIYIYIISKIQAWVVLQILLNLDQCLNPCNFFFFFFFCSNKIVGILKILAPLHEDLIKHPNEGGN